MSSRAMRLPVFLAALLATRLLFIVPRSIVARPTKRAPPCPSHHVALAASGLAGAMMYEAMEVPPDDMEGVDDLRELVARHVDDPRWARINDDRLKRHYLASKMDVAAAYSRLKELVEWQETVFPIDPKFIEEEVKTKKIILHGIDRLGHPVLYTICRRHDRFKRELSSCISNVVASVEEAIHEMQPGIGKLLLVFDARGLGWRQLDLKMIREAINLLQRLYPVRAYRLYAVGLPPVFGYLWSFAKKFLDPISAAKVVFLSDMSQLAEFIDVDEMPEVVRAKVQDPATPRSSK